jgi:hypothetical protein
MKFEKHPKFIFKIGIPFAFSKKKLENKMVLLKSFLK